MTATPKLDKARDEYLTTDEVMTAINELKAMHPPCWLRPASVRFGWSGGAIVLAEGGGGIAEGDTIEDALCEARRQIEAELASAAA